MSRSFAPAIALVDGRQHELRQLVGRKALGAAQTFPPPPDLASLAGQSRIDDLGIAVVTEWAVHCSARRGRALSVDRKPPRERLDLVANVFDDPGIARRIDQIRKPMGNLRGLGESHSARGNGGRPEP